MEIIEEFHNRELDRYDKILKTYQKRLFKKSGETVYNFTNNNLNVNLAVADSNSAADLTTGLVFG